MCHGSEPNKGRGITVKGEEKKLNYREVRCRNIMVELRRSMWR
jgi:hypothetical protein